MKIYAPSDIPEIVVTLPSPNLGDVRRREDTVQLKQAMDGSYRTHIQRTGQVTLRWEFSLTRKKALEVLNFYEQYGHLKWRVVWTETYYGYIKLNPASLEMLRRGVTADSFETVGFAFEFETTPQ